MLSIFGMHNMHALFYTNAQRHVSGSSNVDSAQNYVDRLVHYWASLRKQIVSKSFWAGVDPRLTECVMPCFLLHQSSLGGLP